MKDFLGNELNVGDKVATNIDGYTYSLVWLYVIGFTPKKIKLSRWINVDKDAYLKYPKQVVKI